MATTKTKSKATTKSSGKAETKETTTNKKPRVFVGGGWDNEGEYGTFSSIQLNKNQLMEIPEDKFGNINLTVAKRKTPDERSGKDLSVYVTEPKGGK